MSNVDEHGRNAEVLLRRLRTAIGTDDWAAAQALDLDLRAALTGADVALLRAVHAAYAELLELAGERRAELARQISHSRRRRSSATQHYANVAAGG